MHPYARAFLTLFVSQFCIGGAIVASTASAAAVKEAPGAALGGFLLALLLSVLGIFFLIDAATCAVYGTVRSLRRADERKAAKLATRAGNGDNDGVVPPRRAQSAPAAAEAAPIPLDAAPRSVRLVMRDPTGKLVKFGMRDGSPERQAKYIAKYEADGYKFLRTEDIEG